MASPASAPEFSDPLPPFEQSFAELQQIAHELEEGALGLEDSLKRYERGIVLLRQCYRTLEQAEQKIAILNGFDAAGNAVMKPFDATATAEQSSKPSAGRRKRKSTKPEVSAPELSSDPTTRPADLTEDDSRLF